MSSLFLGHTSGVSNNDNDNDTSYECTMNEIQQAYKTPNLLVLVLAAISKLGKVTVFLPPSKLTRLSLKVLYLPQYRGN